MFVVHTVNQLEEAIRVGAEEILVTGGLASCLHEAYLLKTCKEQERPEVMTVEASQGAGMTERIIRKVGMPLLGISSLLIITDGYALLDAHLDTQFPSMILQRAPQL